LYAWDLRNLGPEVAKVEICDANLANIVIRLP
jgi:hypothetical protein